MLLESQAGKLAVHLGEALVIERIAGEVPGQHVRLPDELSWVGPILFFFPLSCS